MAAGRNSPGRNSRPKLSLAQRRKARRLVMQALYQWQIAKTEPRVIEAEFRQENPGKIDWDYFSEVFLGIPRQVDHLNAHLKPLLDRAVDALDPVERALLYLGTYELAYRIDVPFKVVINEAVELAKVFGATDSYKYVNGVLDKLAAILRPLERKKK